MTGGTAHPKCDKGHICQEPSGRICIERGCEEQAGTGTRWGQYWCPDHDKELLLRRYADARFVAFLEHPEIAWVDQPSQIAKQYRKTADDLYAEADRIEKGGAE